MKNKLDRIDEKKFDSTIGIMVETYFVLLRFFDITDQDIEIDYEIANQVVSRYFRDVERIKHFHSFDRIDCHKIAGYLTYWISRLKPLFVRNYNTYSKIESHAREINEIFAILVGCGRIKADYRERGISDQVVLNRDFFYALSYTLRYRQTTPDLLTLNYYLLDKYSREHSQKGSAQ